MNNQIVTVNLTPGSSTPAVVRVSQGDIGRPIQFKVLDGTSIASFANSATATVVGTKPTGLGFSVTGTISGNTVTINTTLEMTQEAGMIPTEIRFATTSPATDIGTANFILAVEPQTHSSSTTDGTYETMDDIQTQVNALDTRVTALEAGSGGSGLTDDVKTALLNCFAHVAWVDADGQDYYDALESALDSGDLSVSLMLSQVSSSNTATTVGYGESYTTTLTASTGYTLNTVSVTMGGVDITSTAYSSGTVSIPSVTGNIVITATAVLEAQSITATYTQSGTVYDTDSLDSLKADLVVTANYSGGTSETVPSSDYTLSGTLAVGTSTITVTYAGLTDTFSVTVTGGEGWSYNINDLTKVTGAFASESNADCGMALALAYGSNAYRRSFAVGSGDTSVATRNSNGIVSQTSNYYPIKIPAGATSVTVTPTPNTQFVQILARVLNDGVYSTFSTTGWSGYQQGGGTKVCESAPDNAYIFVTLKYDNEGTSYPTEPTGLDIVFA